MRQIRTQRDRLSDAMLSLVLLNYCARTDGTIGDRLKVAKLMFLATHDLLSQQFKALNFSFYRYSYGPFTPELYDTWGELNWMGFLEVPPSSRGEIKLTASGLSAAVRYEKRLKALGNELFIQSFRQVADSYCQYDTKELLDVVYDMKVVPLGWQQPIQIRDIPAKAFLTWVLESEESLREIRIDDELAMDFFNELERSPIPPSIDDETYRKIYASALKGVLAEREEGSGTVVTRSDLQKRLEGEV